MNKIRRMEIQDLSDVVDIHLSAFQNFFLSFLGSGFLNELYKAIIESSLGIAFVYDGANDILGFVAGTEQPRGFYKSLLVSRWWRFGLKSMWPTIKRPSVIPRLLRAFSRGHQPDVHENCATLMSIAVSTKFQGKGIGALLVDAFLMEAKARGAEKVNLTTDKDDNESVNNFYRSLGFELKSTFQKPEGRWMNEYVMDIKRFPPNR